MVMFYFGSWVGFINVFFWFRVGKLGGGGLGLLRDGTAFSFLFFFFSSTTFFFRPSV
jgi:hypothetical protein